MDEKEKCEDCKLYLNLVNELLSSRSFLLKKIIALESLIENVYLNGDS